jgi:DNA-binding CsgD family transcriptional regulator
MLEDGFSIVRTSPTTLLKSSVTQGNGAHCGLRELALVSDAHDARPLQLAELWRQLASGSYRAHDTFAGQSRSYLLLEERPAPPPSTRCDRSIEVLQRILIDGGQKCAAFDLDLAPSSVSSLAKLALARLGFEGPTAQAPLILFMAARAAAEGNADTARSATLRTKSQTIRVLSVERPDLELERLLSPALADVASQFVAGKRRTEIASKRNTSVRTVSNQLRAIFTALHATGRLSLLGALCAHSGTNGPLTLPRESSQGRGYGAGTSA